MSLKTDRTTTQQTAQLEGDDNVHARPVILKSARSVSRRYSHCRAFCLIIRSWYVDYLDHCNSLMYGIADGLMQRLQAVQNAATRLMPSHCLVPWTRTCLGDRAFGVARPHLWNG